MGERRRDRKEVVKVIATSSISLSLLSVCVDPAGLTGKFEKMRVREREEEENEYERRERERRERRELRRTMLRRKV